MQDNDTFSLMFLIHYSQFLKHQFTLHKWGFQGIKYFILFSYFVFL